LNVHVTEEYGIGKKRRKAWQGLLYQLDPVSSEIELANGIIKGAVRGHAQAAEGEAKRAFEGSERSSVEFDAGVLGKLVELGLGMRFAANGAT
jgi:hypothetical protein